MYCVYLHLLLHALMFSCFAPAIPYSALCGPFKYLVYSKLQISCQPQGRRLMYAWMQEHRQVPAPPAICKDYAYAGQYNECRVAGMGSCMLAQGNKHHAHPKQWPLSCPYWHVCPGCITTPRVLSWVDGYLYQTPLPELKDLRCGCVLACKVCKARAPELLHPLHVCTH